MLEKTLEEHYYHILGVLIRVMKERVEDEISESCEFSPFGVYFTIEEREQHGRMGVEPSVDGIRLFLSVFYKDDDRSVCQYLVKGGKKEILAYLEGDSLVDELFHSFGELSDSVTEKWGYGKQIK